MSDEGAGAAAMTVQARAIRQPPTFDERRERPECCPCGRHNLTSSAGPVLVCPWAPPLTGLHSQPEVHPLAE